MKKNLDSHQRAFTLVEILVSIALVTLLTTIVVVSLNPFKMINGTQQTRALEELAQLGKALQYYAIDNGGYPGDVGRGLPGGLEGYIAQGSDWPNGPFADSVYDYDNWSSATCIDGQASGTIQITLRGVPGRNPNGSNNWAWYYVVQGKGTPHCTSASEASLGECVNCPGFKL